MPAPLQMWRVIRTHRGETVDTESFHHFGDAWAYAQPDPDTGIHHYIHKDTVLQHFHETPNDPLTTAYEGNTRIQISLYRSSRAPPPPHPHRRVQIVT